MELIIGEEECRFSTIVNAFFNSNCGNEVAANWKHLAAELGISDKLITIYQNDLLYNTRRVKDIINDILVEWKTNAGQQATLGKLLVVIETLSLYRSGDCLRREFGIPPIEAIDEYLQQKEKIGYTKENLQLDKDEILKHLNKLSDFLVKTTVVDHRAVLFLKTFGCIDDDDVEKLSKRNKPMDRALFLYNCIKRNLSLDNYKGLIKALQETGQGKPVWLLRDIWEMKLKRIEKSYRDSAVRGQPAQNIQDVNSNMQQLFGQAGLQQRQPLQFGFGGIPAIHPQYDSTLKMVDYRRKLINYLTMCLPMMDVMRVNMTHDLNLAHIEETAQTQQILQPEILLQGLFGANPVSQVSHTNGVDSGLLPPTPQDATKTTTTTEATKATQQMLEDSAKRNFVNQLGLYGGSPNNQQMIPFQALQQLLLNKSVAVQPNQSHLPLLQSSGGNANSTLSKVVEKNESNEQQSGREPVIRKPNSENSEVLKALGIN